MDSQDRIDNEARAAFIGDPHNGNCDSVPEIFEQKVTLRYNEVRI